MPSFTSALSTEILFHLHLHVVNIDLLLPALFYLPWGKHQDGSDLFVKKTIKNGSCFLLKIIYITSRFPDHVHNQNKIIQTDISVPLRTFSFFFCSSPKRRGSLYFVLITLYTWLLEALPAFLKIDILYEVSISLPGMLQCTFRQNSIHITVSLR